MSLSKREILDKLEGLLGGEGGEFTDLSDAELLALLARVREAVVTGAPLRAPASPAEGPTTAHLSNAEVLAQLAEARAEQARRRAAEESWPAEPPVPVVEPHPVVLVEEEPAPPVEPPAPVLSEEEQRRRDRAEQEQAEGQRMRAYVEQERARLEAQAVRDWEQAQQPAPPGWGVRSRLYSWMRY